MKSYSKAWGWVSTKTGPSLLSYLLIGLLIKLALLCILLSTDVVARDLQPRLSPSTEKWTNLELLQANSQQPEAWQTCGARLIRLSGRETDQAKAEAKAAKYHRHSASKESEFLIYMFSVAYVESSFNNQAVSTANARGLMQMTSVAVADAVEHCGLRKLESMDKLHDNAVNLRYGTCYLLKLLTQSGGNWVKALITYNGGYRQLWKYEAGEVMAKETREYVSKVKRARELCLTGVQPNSKPIRSEYVAN